MDTSHVKHVMIAGEFKYWNYELVGWNVDKLVRDVTKARERMLKRMNDSGIAAAIGPGLNTPMTNGVYRPPFLTSCCYVGQNNTAPDYNLRP